MGRNKMALAGHPRPCETRLWIAETGVLFFGGGGGNRDRAVFKLRHTLNVCTAERVGSEAAELIVCNFVVAC